MCVHSLMPITRQCTMHLDRCRPRATIIFAETDVAICSTAVFTEQHSNSFSIGRSNETWLTQVNIWKMRNNPRFAPCHSPVCGINSENVKQSRCVPRVSNETSIVMKERCVRTLRSVDHVRHRDNTAVIANRC